MELLLILSAMLTALTGAITGVRGADARAQQNIVMQVAGQHEQATVQRGRSQSWTALAAEPPLLLFLGLLAPLAILAVPAHLDRLRI